MSSGSTPCGIGRPEAGPLIDALHHDSPATRLAVLDALTRLPLEPDVWFEVREYVVWALKTRRRPSTWTSSRRRPACRLGLSDLGLRRFVYSPQRDRRLSTSHFELTHVLEVVLRSDERFAGRIGEENRAADGLRHALDAGELPVFTVSPHTVYSRRRSDRCFRT